MGEKQNQPFQLSFNASWKVDFQGRRVTSDGGLVLGRELDERLGLREFRRAVDRDRFRCCTRLEKEKCLWNGWEKRQFLASGFCRGHRKGSALKNLAGALHADGVGCTLSVGREVKMEIPAYSSSGAKLLPAQEAVPRPFFPSNPRQLRQFLLYRHQLVSNRITLYLGSHALCRQLLEAKNLPFRRPNLPSPRSISWTSGRSLPPFGKK